MGLLDDIFSGRTSDIYGAGLLTPEQRGGIGNRGLLALAAQLGKSAGPSFSPVPDFGAALGMAAGAYGAGTDEAGKDALNAILTGLKGTDLQSQLAIRKQVLGLLPSLLAGDGAAAGAPATSGSTGGGAAAPAGAGGGGGGAGAGAGGVPAQYAELINRAAAKENVDPAVLTSLIGHESSFRPDIRGTSGEVGLAQLMPGTAQSLGVTDRTDPTQSIFAAARYLRQGLDAHGGDYTMALRYYNGGPGGVNNPQTLTYANTVLGGAKRYGGTAATPTAAAPDGVRVPYNYGAPSGGLLNLPEVPSLSSRYFGAPQADAGDTSAPADVAPAAQAAPWAAGNVAQYARAGDRGGPVTVEGVTYPSVSAWNRARDARATATADWAATPAATSGGGGLLAVPPGAGSDTYVTPQGPAGDAGPAGPTAMGTGLLAPGGPLTRQFALPPVAAPPAIDPALRGPLAVPQPEPAAAAAPAAAAPRGLLAPPAAALPAVPAAPNINARALAAAGVLSQLGGLPDIFKPLENFYYQSPGYKGQVTTAEEAAKSQFVGSNAAATAAAQDPYIRGQAQAKSDLDLRNDLLKQGVVRNADGSLRQAAEAELAALTAKDRATPTTEMKDYAGYVKDQQMRNLSALSYFDWSLANKKAGAASTVLNTTEGFEAAQTRARIAIDTKLAETIGDQALTGKRLAPLLDEVIRLANQTPEGMAGPIAVTTARAFSSLGIPVSDRMSNAELLNTITQRLVPIVREPGATSQGELNTYLQASPGLMQSAAGRIKIAEMTKALIARTDEIAKVYRNNLGAPDLHDKLSALDKPLFTDDQRAAMNAVIGGTRTAPAATGGAPAAPSGSIATPYGTITPVQ